MHCGSRETWQKVLCPGVRSGGVVLTSLNFHKRGWKLEEEGSNTITQKCTSTSTIHINVRKTII